MPADASHDLEIDGLAVVRSCEKVHQISCSFPIGFLFEGDVEVGSLAEHIKDRPQCEPARSISFKAEIDPKPINACGLDGRRRFRHVRCAEIMVQQLVQVHALLLPRLSQ